MKQELVDEELDVLLEEFDLISSPSPEPTVEKEASFEELVEEICELTQPPSPAAESSSLPTLPLETGTKKRSNMTIWITATLLIGLFAGCAFGFFWAKNEGLLDQPIVEPQEEITTQISYWIKELNKLYETLDPPPPSECIEPLDPPTEHQTLAPSEMT